MINGTCVHFDSQLTAHGEWFQKRVQVSDPVTNGVDNVVTNQVANQARSLKTLLTKSQKNVVNYCS